MPRGVDAWPDPSGIHAGTSKLGHPEGEDADQSVFLPSEDEIVIQRVEAEIDRIASQQETFESLSTSPGDPPAYMARCVSGVGLDCSSDSSD